MCANDVTLEVGDESYPGRVNFPDESTERGILMLPGAGHGPFGDIFLRFGRKAADAGYTVARFETWPFPDDLEQKDEDEFAADVEAGVEYLEDQGCTDITVVAKSFGGSIALNFAPEKVDRMVLWAPAVDMDPDEGDPTPTPEELAAIDVPVRVLQGDEDRGFSVENAQAIVDHLPDAELVELPGENHSFISDHERNIEETMAFLPEEA